MACGSTTCSAIAVVPQIGPASPPSRDGRLAHWLASLARMHDRYLQRQELAELSDHLLDDIGVSREEALREAGKPFWR
jgi:uncharacterized protein YjiS (DUF1127 family)